MRRGLGRKAGRWASAGLLVLAMAACNGGAGSGAGGSETTVTLPSGDACRSEQGGGEAQSFDHLVAVLGDGITLGRTATVTVCAVPDAYGESARVSLTATGGATLDHTSISWTGLTEGRRELGKVEVTVPDGVLTKVTADLVLFDADGEPAARALTSVQLLGGPDAVFSSTEAVGQRLLRELALLRELRAGRISEEQYERRIHRLGRDGGPDATLSPGH